MNYYRDLITQKSWSELQKLSKTYRFVLIGDWAVWVYTKKLKSKDIDIIMEFSELGRIRSDFSLTKNDRLRKYEVVSDQIQVDIYVPHWSIVGFPAEEIIHSAQPHEGFRVPPPEVLLITKLAAYSARAGSVKGRKDMIDIISLLSLKEFSWNKFRNVIVKHEENFASQLRDLVKNQIEVPELDLNRHQLAKKKKAWLAQIGK